MLKTIQYSTSCGRTLVKTSYTNNQSVVNETTATRAPGKTFPLELVQWLPISKYVGGRAVC